MDIIADDLDIMAVQFGQSLMESDLKQYEDSSDQSDTMVSAEDFSDNTAIIQSESSEGKSTATQNYNYLPHKTPEIKNASESNQFVCTDCGMMYTKQSSLSNHRLSKHAFVCESCGSRFGVRANYESHVQFGCGRTAPAAEQFECMVCHKILHSKKTLNKHLKHHYGIGSYRCKICQKLFQQRTHLDAHMRTHDGHKPFSCRLCGNSYSEKSSMTRHLRKTHDTSDTDLIENRIFEAVSAAQQVVTNASALKVEDTENETLVEGEGDFDNLHTDTVEQTSESPVGNEIPCNDKMLEKSVVNDLRKSVYEPECKNSEESVKKQVYKIENEVVEFDDDIPEKLPIDERDEQTSVKDEENMIDNFSDSFDSDNFYEDDDDNDDDESPGEPPPNIGEIIAARIRKSQNDLNMALMLKQKEDNLGINDLHIGMERESGNLKVSSLKKKSFESPVVNKILQVPLSRDCHICGKALSSPSALRKHVSRHKDADAYKCVLCKKSFLETSALQEHMIAHQFEKKIKCDFCKVMFTEKSTYRRHLRRFHDFTLDSAREYVHINCKELGPEDYAALMNTWKTENTLDDNSKTSDTENSKSEKQTDLSSSEIMSSPTVGICNSILSVQSRSRKQLAFEASEVKADMIEIKTQHQSTSDHSFLPDPKVYDCQLCGRLLGNGTSLRRHIKRHGDDFRCTICKRVFHDSETLRQHMSVHNQQYLICNICGKTLTERSRYRSHLRTEHGFTLEGAQAYADGLHDDKGFKKVFNISGSEEHSILNLEEAKVVSDNKNLRKTNIKEISDYSQAYNHEEKANAVEGASLNGSSCPDDLSSNNKAPEVSADIPNSKMNFMFKNYECPICGKQLGDASARSKHIRRHDGHVAFECEICSEVFPQIRLIESHVKTHTLRGAKCNVCLLYFADRSSARRHLVKIHGMSPNSNQIEDHMADCFGDDDFGGYDASLHYTVIDIKKNPSVKVRDCYNSVLSSAVYQRMYESVREKYEQAPKNFSNSVDAPNMSDTTDANPLQKVSEDVKPSFVTEVKREKIKDEIDLYINQNSSVTFSVVNKRKAEEQPAVSDKKIKTEIEIPHQPLKLVLKREPKEFDDGNVNSPIFSIKENMLDPNEEDNEKESVKSEKSESDNTVNCDLTNQDNLETHDVSDSVAENSYSKDNLESDVALLDEEIKKRLLNEPSVFLPVHEMIPSHSNERIPQNSNVSLSGAGTSAELDVSEGGSSVKTQKSEKHLCFDCEKYFASYKSYRAHRRRFHPMTCDICNEKFLDLILYQSHIQGHLQLTQAKRYDCPVCGKYIKDASSRAKHLRLHTGEKPYACEICGKRFTQTGHLASHMRLHSGEKPYDCRLCGKYFSEKSSVKRHLRKIHFNQYNKKCVECGVLCVTREDYKEHMVTHAKTVYSCELCQKDFPDSKRLKLHNFNSHDKMKEDARTYACKECEKYFFSTKGLKNHVRRFHTNEVPVYDCALCSRTFLTTLTLESHMATHIKKDLYCLACNKPFRTNGSLSLHKKRHIISFIQKCEKSAPDCYTSDAEIKVEPLDNDNISGYSMKKMKTKEIDRLMEDFVLTINNTPMYTNYCIYRPECILDHNLVQKYLRSNKNEPENQAIEEKPDPKKIFTNKTNPRSLNIYRCNSCGLFLTTKKHLMRHVIALHKQKSVKCTLCSSKFSTNVLLRAHMRRIHDGGAGRKLVCKFCDKELKGQRNLREHLRLHTGDLPYSCTECSKAFSTHSKLTFHMETHNKIQRQCPKCNTKFVHERSYRLHMLAQCLGRRKRAKFESQKRVAENYSMNYDCTICGRQYRYQESLYVHIKTDHGGIDLDISSEGSQTAALDQRIIDNAISDVVENGITDGSYSNHSQTLENDGNELNKNVYNLEKLSELDAAENKDHGAEHMDSGVQ